MSFAFYLVVYLTYFTLLMRCSTTRLQGLSMQAATRQRLAIPRMPYHYRRRVSG